MAQLTVDLNDVASIEMGLSILTGLSDGAAMHYTQEAVEDVSDLMGGDEVGMEDFLDEPDPEPEFTVDAMKNSFKELAKAAGKEAAVALVKKALAKLGVAKIEEVPEEKRESFIKILDMTAAKAAKK